MTGHTKKDKKRLSRPVRAGKNGLNYSEKKCICPKKETSQKTKTTERVTKGAL